VSRTPPAFVGMPPREREIKTAYGPIIAGGACRDDYHRIVVHVQHAQHYLKLQRAAVRSIVEVETKLGYPVICTGSWRACSTQTRLYASDKNRYAHPSKTAHCRGLAIDVSTNLPKAKQDAIRRALLNRGWHQSRPDDEPWHYSFGIQV